MKRIIVNLLIVLVLAGISLFCFHMGKSYKILLENIPYMADGVEEPSIEAMQVTIDKQDSPIYMLDGDRMFGNATGQNHILTIEILDIKDQVIETKQVTFSMEELDAKLSINVARAYRTGEI